jgi:2-oxoglutarate ferredoxin oxidoreductase subunit beta
MVDVIAKGIAHKGFSIIECVSACPINFGRQNKAGTAAKMMEWQRDHGVMKAAWDKMDDEKRAEAIAAGKFPIGVLFETNEVQEYTEAYDEVIRRAQGGK